MSNFDENFIFQIEIDVLVLNLRVQTLENPDFGSRIVDFYVRCHIKSYIYIYLIAL